MNDLISRQDAINALKRHEELCWEDACFKPLMSDARIIIEGLPSAEPEKEDCTELKQEFIRMASYIDSLLACSDEQKETLIGFISRLSEYMPWTERD